MKKSDAMKHYEDAKRELLAKDNVNDYEFGKINGMLGLMFLCGIIDSNIYKFERDDILNKLEKK